MVSSLTKQILEQVNKNLENLDDEEVEKFIEELSKSKTVFITGAGRSGLVAKAFAMRLMHMGLNVHIVGDTVTPPVKEGDLMIAITGSGGTSSVKIAVEAAEKHGATTFAITGNPKSSVGRMADFVIKISTSVPRVKAKDYIANQLEGITATLTPLGTVFELSALVFCDSIIAELMDRLSISEEQMKEKHTNIE